MREIEDLIIGLTNRKTKEIEGFLLACKDKGDKTIYDVIKLLKALKKTDSGSGASSFLQLLIKYLN